MVGANATAFIVDDSQQSRTHLERLVKKAGLRSASFGSGREFLAAFHIAAEDLPLGERRPATPFPSPGCLLLDLEMPELDGLAVQQVLRGQGLFLPTIVVSGTDTVHKVVAAHKGGAVVYLEKPARLADLVVSLREALRQDEEFRRDHALQVELQGRWEELTPTQSELAEILASGKEVKEIARALHKHVETVRKQEHDVLQTMQAESVVELANMVRLLRAELNPWKG